ncbi:MAG: hypothetical protein ACO1TE_14130 [Prosthecobacter sp.]
MIKIIRRRFGLIFGHFKDQYEVATSCDRSKAVDVMLKGFSKLGFPISGRGYDGSFFVPIASRHEVAFYVREGCVVIEDRFQTFIWLRLWPSWLRRHLPALTKPLIE